MSDYINKALDCKTFLGLTAFVEETGYPFNPLKVNPLAECGLTAFTESVPSARCWKTCKEHLVNFMQLTKVYNDYENEYKKKFNGAVVRDLVVRKPVYREEEDSEDNTQDKTVNCSVCKKTLGYNMSKCNECRECICGFCTFREVTEDNYSGMTYCAICFYKKWNQVDQNYFCKEESEERECAGMESEEEDISEGRGCTGRKCHVCSEKFKKEGKVMRCTECSRDMCAKCAKKRGLIKDQGVCVDCREVDEEEEEEDIDETIESDKHPCKKCGNKFYMTHTLQTRKADETSTVHETCPECTSIKTKTEKKVCWVCGETLQGRLVKCGKCENHVCKACTKIQGTIRMCKNCITKSLHKAAKLVMNVDTCFKCKKTKNLHECHSKSHEHSICYGCAAQCDVCATGMCEGKEQICRDCLKQAKTFEDQECFMCEASARFECQRCTSKMCPEHTYMESCDFGNDCKTRVIFCHRCNEDSLCNTCVQEYCIDHTIKCVECCEYLCHECDEYCTKECETCKTENHVCFKCEDVGWNCKTCSSSTKKEKKVKPTTSKKEVCARCEEKACSKCQKCEEILCVEHMTAMRCDNIGCKTTVVMCPTCITHTRCTRCSAHTAYCIDHTESCGMCGGKTCLKCGRFRMCRVCEGMQRVCSTCEDMLMTCTSCSLKEEKQKKDAKEKKTAFLSSDMSTLMNYKCHMCKKIGRSCACEYCGTICCKNCCVIYDCGVCDKYVTVCSFTECTVPLKCIKCENACCENCIYDKICDTCTFLTVPPKKEKTASKRTASKKEKPILAKKEKTVKSNTTTSSNPSKHPCPICGNIWLILSDCKQCSKCERNMCNVCSNDCAMCPKVVCKKCRNVYECEICERDVPTCGHASKPICQLCDTLTCKKCMGTCKCGQKSCSKCTQFYGSYDSSKKLTRCGYCVALEQGLEKNPENSYWTCVCGSDTRYNINCSYCKKNTGCRRCFTPKKCEKCKQMIALCKKCDKKKKCSSCK